MGTGVGGGIVIRGNDGQAFVLNGLQGIGGEWGHNVLEENGYPCYCGKSGCVEQVLSGTALQRFYQDQSGEFRKLPAIVARHKAVSYTHLDVYKRQTVSPPSAYPYYRNIRIK